MACVGNSLKIFFSLKMSREFGNWAIAGGDCEIKRNSFFNMVNTEWKERSPKEQRPCKEN